MDEITYEPMNPGQLTAKEYEHHIFSLLDDDDWTTRVDKINGGLRVSIDTGQRFDIVITLVARNPRRIKWEEDELDRGRREEDNYSYLDK